MGVLRLKGLNFYGFHGTEAWEKETGCRFTIDLELAKDFGPASRSDRLEDTLDYREIYAQVRRIVTEESHGLIEKVAGRILEEMFHRLPVSHVTVRVGKPEARIGGLNQNVEIELSYSRRQWDEENAHRAKDQPNQTESAAYGHQDRQTDL